VEHIKKYRNSICQHRIVLEPPLPFPTDSPHDLKYQLYFAKSDCCHGCGSFKVCMTLKPSALLTLTHCIISGVSHPNCWPLRVIVTLLTKHVRSFSSAKQRQPNKTKLNTFESNHCYTFKIKNTVFTLHLNSKQVSAQRPRP
jgi:hypothetical protein